MEKERERERETHTERYVTGWFREEMPYPWEEITVWVNANMYTD